MEKQIACVRAGRFYAWFDQVDNRFSVQWVQGDSQSGFIFKDIESAREVWHKDVIDRKGFKHCYCC